MQLSVVSSTWLLPLFQVESVFVNNLLQLGGSAIFVAGANANISLVGSTQLLNCSVFSRDMNAATATVGGAIYAFAENSLWYSDTGGTYQYNQVGVADSQATEGNQIGGGAVYLLSVTTTVTATFTNSTFLDSAVLLQGLQSPQSAQGNCGGGGALYTNAFTVVSLTLNQCAFTRNVALMNQSLGSLEVGGGGAVFLFTALLSASFSATNTTFTSNAYSSLGEAAGSQGLFVGGGAVMAQPNDGFTMSLTGVLFVNNSVVCGNPSSQTGMSVGGGGLFLYSQGSIPAALSVIGVYATGNSIAMSGALQLGTTTRPAAFGGGVLYAISDSNLAMEVLGGAFENSGGASSNITAVYSGVFVGGGAVLAISASTSTAVSLAGVFVQNCAVGALDVTVQSGVFVAGGGGLLALSQTQTFANITDTVFESNQLRAQNAVVTAVDQAVRLGGGALMLQTFQSGVTSDINLNMTATVMVGNQLLASAIAAEDSVVGGGAVYLFTTYAPCLSACRATHSRRTAPMPTMCVCCLPPRLSVRLSNCVLAAAALCWLVTSSAARRAMPTASASPTV